MNIPTHGVTYLIGKNIPYILGSNWAHPDPSFSWDLARNSEVFTQALHWIDTTVKECLSLSGLWFS